MKISEILDSDSSLELLFENRIDYVINSMEKALTTAMEKDNSNVYGTVSALVRAMVAEADPSTNGQFITFLSRMYAAGQFKIEDFSRIKTELGTFIKVKSKLQNKDINSYNNLTELYAALDALNKKDPKDLMSGKEAKREIKKDVDYLIDEKDFKVLSPKTEEAACFYGSNTRWCTASKNDNQFNTYNKDGKIYIVIAKINGQFKKFQFHYHSGQAMNEMDQAITKTEIAELSKYPEYKDFLHHLIKLHYEPLIEK